MNGETEKKVQVPYNTCCTRRYKPFRLALPLKLRTLVAPRLASISATPGSTARAVTVLRTEAGGEAVAVPTARAPRSNACTRSSFKMGTLKCEREVAQHG